VLPNLLVKAEGEVLLRRSGWADFIPVGFGTLLAPGDLVRVADGNSAAVFCGSDGDWGKGTNALAADGVEHGVPCKSGKPPRPWADVVALRSESDPNLLYAISPRNTALLNDKPTLLWHPLDGVNTYTITVLGDDGKTRHAGEAQGHRFDWPADWQPLVPGANYVLVLEGDGVRSDAAADGNVGLGFWLLPEKESAAIHEQVEQLRLAGLDAQATDLLVAELYRQYALRSEAIQLYQALAASQGSPAVWLALGQTYLEVGLAMQAEQAFEQALAAAQSTGQREAEAAALFGSGMAQSLLHSDAAAQESFRAARDVYQQIGDKNNLAQLDELISK
jgi:tetratricopeptide (TPR) repeat protein